MAVMPYPPPTFTWERAAPDIFPSTADCPPRVLLCYYVPLGSFVALIQVDAEGRWRGSYATDFGEDPVKPMVKVGPYESMDDAKTTVEALVLMGE